MSSFLGSDYLIGNAVGKRLFAAIRNLPVIDPHNHVDVREVAANGHYRDAWQLFAATDHYVWEMLRQREVPEALITGKAAPKEKFLAMAKVFPELAGNPVYEWVHLDLQRYFCIDELLSPASGERIWNAVNAKLATDAFRPQQLLTGPLNVEAMSSTDDPCDLLKEHAQINRQVGRELIHPTWRPDKAMRIYAADWKDYLRKLGARFGMKVTSVAALLKALRKSHDYFAAHGCHASDHGVETPLAADGDLKLAERLFTKAMAGEALSRAETDAFMGVILRECAEMNAETGWVTQIHAGAVRDVRKVLWEALGPDVGGDVSTLHQDFFTPLNSFLNHFDSRLKTVLYTLEPAQYATLATLSRAYGSTVRLGSAWWLCDHPVGMKRQLEWYGSVALWHNFAGMVSDSRKILSYGSRFEMFRRVLADVLGEAVEMGRMPEEAALPLAVKMAYTEPKAFWGI